MEDLERYLYEIVEPTLSDFRNDPSSRRLGFLTCVAVDHSVDYFAFPKNAALWDSAGHRSKRTKLRREFREESEAFGLVSEAANAFKHVKTTSSMGLEAAHVYERPPALPGRMMVGASIIGDGTGAVVVNGKDLLNVATEAVNFLRLKVHKGT